MAFRRFFSTLNQDRMVQRKKGTKSEGATTVRMISTPLDAVENSLIFCYFGRLVSSLAFALTIHGREWSRPLADQLVDALEGLAASLTLLLLLLMIPIEWRSILLPFEQPLILVSIDAMPNDNFLTCT